MERSTTRSNGTADCFTYTRNAGGGGSGCIRQEVKDFTIIRFLREPPRPGDKAFSKTLRLSFNFG